MRVEQRQVHAAGPGQARGPAALAERAPVAYADVKAILFDVIEARRANPWPRCCGSAGWMII